MKNIYISNIYISVEHLNIVNVLEIQMFLLRTKKFEYSLEWKKNKQKQNKYGIIHWLCHNQKYFY